jgi:hypothetical protein
MGKSKAEIPDLPPFFHRDLRAAEAKSSVSTSWYKRGVVIGGMANFVIRSIDNIPLKLY